MWSDYTKSVCPRMWSAPHSACTVTRQLYIIIGRCGVLIHSMFYLHIIYEYYLNLTSLSAGAKVAKKITIDAATRT